MVPPSLSRLIDASMQSIELWELLLDSPMLSLLSVVMKPSGASAGGIRLTKDAEIGRPPQSDLLFPP